MKPTIKSLSEQIEALTAFVMDKGAELESRIDALEDEIAEEICEREATDLVLQSLEIEVNSIESDVHSLELDRDNFIERFNTLESHLKEKHPHTFNDKIDRQTVTKDNIKEALSLFASIGVFGRQSKECDQKAERARVDRIYQESTKSVSQLMKEGHPKPSWSTV